MRGPNPGSARCTQSRSVAPAEFMVGVLRSRKKGMIPTATAAGGCCLSPRLLRLLMCRFPSIGAWCVEGGITESRRGRYWDVFDTVDPDSESGGVVLATRKVNDLICGCEYADWFWRRRSPPGARQCSHALTRLLNVPGIVRQTPLSTQTCATQRPITVWSTTGVPYLGKPALSRQRIL